MFKSIKIYILVFLTLGLFMLPKLLKILNDSNKANENSITNTTIAIQSNSNSKQPIPPQALKQSSPTTSPDSKSPHVPLQPKDYLEAAVESSQKEQEQFEKTALIKMKFPKDIIFAKQDSDENMIAMVGRKQNSSQIIGVFARNQTSSNEEVSHFMPELAQRVSGVPPELVATNTTPEPYVVDEQSPFKNVYTWHIENDKNILYLIKADRKDNVGSYMIFMTGSKKDTQRTEKDLENIINSIEITSGK